MLKLSLYLLALLLLAGLVWTFRPGAATVGEPPVPEEWRGLEPLLGQRIRESLAEVESSPRSPQRWAQLAMLYHANDLVDLAGPCYEQSLALNDGDAQLWYLLGRLRSELGDVSGALQAVDEAAALDPKQSFVHWRRGFWLLRLGRLEEAETSFTVATERDPADPIGTIGLARIAEQRGAYSDAANILEQLLARHPQLPNTSYVRDRLGRAYQQLGRSSEAQPLLSQQPRKSLNWPDPWSDALYQHRWLQEWLILQAHGKIRARDPQAALQILEPLREFHPDDPTLLKMLGMAYFSSGEHDRAIAMLERVIEKQPQEFSAYLNLGFVYEQQGRWQEAVRCAGKAVELNPTSSAARSQLARVTARLQELPEGDRSPR